MIELFLVESAAGPFWFEETREYAENGNDRWVTIRNFGLRNKDAGGQPNLHFQFQLQYCRGPNSRRSRQALLHGVKKRRSIQALSWREGKMPRRHLPSGLDYGAEPAPDRARPNPVICLARNGSPRPNVGVCVPPLNGPSPDGYELSDSLPPAPIKTCPLLRFRRVRADRPPHCGRVRSLRAMGFSRTSGPRSSSTMKSCSRARPAADGSHRSRISPVSTFTK